jgi:integrase
MRRSISEHARSVEWVGGASYLTMAAATLGLTPYSLRHGYAWRGHKAYERSIPVRDLAALMGHNPATHNRHYGKWTNEAGLEEAVVGATGVSISALN